VLLWPRYFRCVESLARHCGLLVVGHLDLLLLAISHDVRERRSFIFLPFLLVMLLQTAELEKQARDMRQG
jgi:hypothetical protein